MAKMRLAQRSHTLIVPCLSESSHAHTPPSPALPGGMPALSHRAILPSLRSWCVMQLWLLACLEPPPVSSSPGASAHQCSPVIHWPTHILLYLSSLPPLLQPSSINHPSPSQLAITLRCLHHDRRPCPGLCHGHLWPAGFQLRRSSAHRGALAPRV